MKKMSKLIKKNHRRNLLATSVAAVCTMVVSSSITQASDIDVYQQAKAGNVTLMFLLDISGSMSRYNSNTAGYACDLPNGVNESGYAQATEAPLTDGPSYRRQWCLAVGSDRIYKFRSYKKKKTTYYQSCKDPQSDYAQCVWSTESTTAPKGISDNGITQQSVDNYVYYYMSKEERFYDRITRLKDGMIDLLYGNPDKKIVRLSDDKIIGLSTLGAIDSNDNYANTGAVLIPARRLDADVNGIKQRDLLLDAVKKFQGRTYTPTARSYAETVAYLMGSNTNRTQEIVRQQYFKLNDYNSYAKCTAWLSNGDCNNSWDYWYTGAPPSGTKGSSGSLFGYAGYYYTAKVTIDLAGSGFKHSSDATKNTDKTLYVPPSSFTQTDASKQCSGQGVYVLTDGYPTQDTDSLPLLQNALGTKGSTFSCDGSSWDCSHKMATTLLNTTLNPSGLKIRTAVVGFGSEFVSVESFDPNKTKAQNIAALGAIDTDPKKAAYWGIIGEGGWYKGNNSKDVVDSVNNFINSLSTEIPAVTTGSPTIPKDALNPALLQDDAYYQQFQPTPDKSYQLWTGNLKKYLVDSNGVLKGKDGNKIVDTNGKLVDNYDYWATDIIQAQKDADENTLGSNKFALRGGAWSQLLLRTDPNNDPENGTIQRKLFTDRVYLSGTDGSSVFGENDNNLRQVKPTDLIDSNYKNDSYRGYLVRLLGYNVDAVNPPTDMNVLKTTPEFRQMGAAMHSQPILVTNKGKLKFNTSTKVMDSTNREDYILFGTTQGLLQVVDAKTGKEKFAFVPDEMLINQRDAFLKPESTSGGTDKLYYGIDGPWSAYTEYVIDSSGNLTVGNGKGNQKGVQDVYGGLRMGGKSYYALDLRDINTPKLKFHIDPAGTCSGTNPLGCMGQSWSKPTITFVNWGGKRTRVMFVGGGYDIGYENAAYNQANKEGAGVYMFRAEDEKGSTGKAGDLLWWGSANATTSSADATGTIGSNNPNLQYSVVSEIRTVDRNGDDLADHIYFGDLGGQVFRVDFDNSQTALGEIVKTPVRIFNGHQANGKSPRFYDMPAFSLYSNNGTIFAVISQGSGNRSKPLFADSSYSYDAIYNIYDKDVARKDIYSADSWNSKDTSSSSLVKLTDTERKDDTTLKAPYSSNGWYYEFTNCVTGYGKCDSYVQQTEKVFGTPVALNKKLFVSTFDASKDGFSGDCGAGVKGASLMTTFCLPYGQCKSDDVTGKTRSIISAGIHTITVGNDKKTSGGGSDNGPGGGETKDKEKSSASNYCISTGGRMTITVTGGVSTGEQTQMCLIPQRWYERTQ